MGVKPRPQRRHVFKAAPWIISVEEASGWPLVNCPSTFEDNPKLDRKAYEKQRDAATSTNADMNKAWKFGDWAIARGAFFSTVLNERRMMV